MALDQDWSLRADRISAKRKRVNLVKLQEVRSSVSHAGSFSGPAIDAFRQIIRSLILRGQLVRPNF